MAPKFRNDSRAKQDPKRGEHEAGLLNIGIHLKPGGSKRAEPTTALAPKSTTLGNLSKWIAQRDTHLEVQIPGAGTSTIEEANSMAPQKRKAAEVHGEESPQKRIRKLENVVRDGAPPTKTKGKRVIKPREDPLEVESPGAELPAEEVPAEEVPAEEVPAEEAPAVKSKPTKGMKKAVVAKKPIELPNIRGGHNTRSAAVSIGNIPTSGPGQLPVRRRRPNSAHESSTTNITRKAPSRTTRPRTRPVREDHSKEVQDREDDAEEDYEEEEVEEGEEAGEQLLFEAGLSRPSGEREINDTGFDSVDQRDDEGMTTMLLAPSPQKLDPPRPASRSRVIGSTNAASASGRQPQAENDVAAGDQGEDVEEDEVEGVAEQKPKGTRRKLTEEVFPEDQVDADLLFKLATVDLMRRNARQVYHSKDGDSGDEEEEKHPRKTQSDLAKRILRSARGLSQIYRSTVVEKDEMIESIASTQDRLMSLTEATTEMVRYLRTTKLRNTHSVDVLEDLFFHVLPALLDTLFTAAKAYTLHKDIPDSSLSDLSAIVNALRRISLAAFKHKDATPEQGLKRKNRHCLFEQPMKTNKASLDKLYKVLVSEREERDEEINRLRRKEDVAQYRARVAESEIRRKQEMANAKAVLQFKISEREERQREQLSSQFDDPILGPLLLKAARKELDGLRGDILAPPVRPRTVSHQNLPRLSQDAAAASVESDEQEEDDEDQIERVSVFEYDTRSKSVAPPSWTPEERDAFLKIMRDCSHLNERFDLAAQYLNKPYDEVIDYAKDFQKHMDDAHARGELMEEHNEWTLLVWDSRAHG